MAILHVRNVPDELHQRIQARARAHNRSLSAEVVTLLSMAVTEPDVSQGALLAGIRRRRLLRASGRAIADSTTLLREDRAR